MAIVNKFNVNKQQVTLDADIIENMSANDVSYDASTQYDENTVGDKLSELNQKIGYTEHSQLVFANTVIDRPASVFPCKIKSGTSFVIYFESIDNCLTSIGSVDSSNSSGSDYTHLYYNVPVNQLVEFSPVNYDIEYLAFYSYAHHAISNGTVKIHVYQNVEYDIIKLKNLKYLSTISSSGKNMYNLFEDIDGKYIHYLQTIGSPIHLASASGTSVSGRINVISGNYYALSTETFIKNMYICFTDSNDNVVAFPDGSVYITMVTNRFVQAPVGSVYMRVTTKWDNTHVENFQVEENCEFTDYESFIPRQIADYSNLPHFLSIVEQKIFKLDKRLYGKKWVVFGDSLTEKNFRAKVSYYDYIQQELGLTVINKGVSGTGYMNRQDQGTAFYQRMLNVGNDFDVLTIFGSLNDGNHPLGNWNDHDTTTICGCVNQTIDNFISVAPFKKLGIITPTPWSSSWNNTDELKYGEAYANALIEICSARGIPCLDLYHYSGLRPWEEDFRVEYYNEDGIQDDGVHPNSKGHKYFYPLVREFILNLFSYLDTNI